MAVSKRGEYSYGTDDADIRSEIVKYSRDNKYKAVKFATALCACGSSSFALETDEDAGVANRICAACGTTKLMGDSAKYFAEATLENHVCVCDHDYFGIMSGVALYRESNDVRWYYIGCRCRSCSLVGVFADWKSESGEADVFLAET